jgi:hypothetical protein
MNDRVLPKPVRIKTDKLSRSISTIVEGTVSWFDRPELQARNDSQPRTTAKGGKAK